MNKLLVKREYRKAQDIDEDFFYDNEWQEEKTNNFDDQAADNNKFLGKFLSAKRINILGFIIFLVMLIFFFRSFQLQIVKGEYYSALADNNRTKETHLISPRGLIYDKNLTPLVKNIPIFDAYIIPKDLSFNQEDRQNQVNEISQVLELEKGHVETILDQYPPNYKFRVLIKEEIPYQEALQLLIKEEKFSGLYIQTRNYRNYLYPYEFAHILGYIGKITEDELNDNVQSEYLLNDYIGKNGLELYYEKQLRGQYGREIFEVDAGGEKHVSIFKQEPVSGQSLVLTIDAVVQQNIRRILAENLVKFNKTRASVVMLDSNNGQVLAFISLPDFNNNLFTGGISHDDYKKLIDDQDKPLYNRVLKGEYPSGSTIKTVVAAGALQEGIVTENTSFLSTGGLMIHDRWFFPDWASGGHGRTNIYRAISWSVNTYFYIVGGGYEDFQGLGVEGLVKYYKMFGIGSKTGIDIYGEKSGLLPNPAWKMKYKDEEWYIGDTYHLAIGQGDLLVTPLQVANYTSVFANQGKLYKPHLVKSIITNGGEEKEISPEIIRQDFIDETNLETIKKAMRQTVTNGSAQYLNNLNVEVAGKTGTAQWHPEKENHAWFTCFAPYENPEVVLTVIVEEGGEGSEISVPISFEILDWYFNHYLNS